jgi:predicted metal-dependent phosphoesterase TrpH
MAARLAQAGLVIPEERLTERVAKGNAGRPHLAWLLIQAGLVKDISQAFELWLGEQGAAWLPKEAPDTAGVAQRVRERGGWAVVAHPAKTLPAEALPLLLELGVAGLECHHPSHTRAATRTLVGLAQDHGLCITAGSDYHGRPDRREPYLRPELTLEAVGGALGEHLRRARAALDHTSGASRTMGAS